MREKQGQIFRCWLLTMLNIGKNVQQSQELFERYSECPRIQYIFHRNLELNFSSRVWKQILPNITSIHFQYKWLTSIFSYWSFSSYSLDILFEFFHILTIFDSYIPISFILCLFVNVKESNCTHGMTRSESFSTIYWIRMRKIGRDQNLYWNCSYIEKSAFEGDEISLNWIQFFLFVGFRF